METKNNKKRIPSPCVNKCKLQDKVCLGCGRTLKEIRKWSIMTDEEREAVFSRLKELKEPKKVENNEQEISDGDSRD